MRSQIKACFLLILLAGVPYLVSLKGSFVYDDSVAVLENMNVTRNTPLHHIFFDKQTMSLPGLIYRPLRDLSYRIEWSIYGEQPRGYHATNVALHIVVTLASYWLLTLLLRDRTISFTAAALFAVHPIHTESVAWIKGRDDLLFTLLFIFSFCSYLLYEESAGWKRVSYYISSLVLFILSLLSKEMAVSLPITLALYQSIFRKFKPLILIPYVILVILYGGLRTHVLGQVGQQGYWGDGVIPTLLTMIKVFVQYIKLTLLPINQCADYRSFPISMSLDHNVIFALILLVTIIIVFFVTRNKVIKWGGLFFFITLLPVSNIIPIQALIAERFLYLPSLGFSAVAAAFLQMAFCEKKRLSMIFVVVVFLMSVLTVHRAGIWNDEYLLWRDGVNKMPENSFAHNNLGVVYYMQGRLDEALRECQTAIRLDPYFPFAHNNLGMTYYRLGQLNKAMEAYKMALALDPSYHQAHFHLGDVYYKTGKLDEAIREYHLAIGLKPNYVKAYMHLSLAYQRLGKIDDAIAQYQAVLRLEPKLAKAHYGLGVLYLKKGLKDKAMEEFETALRLRPDHLPSIQAIQSIEVQQLNLD